MAHPITAFRPGHAGAVASQGTRELKERRAGTATDGIDSLASSKVAATLESVSSKAYLPQMVQFMGGLAITPFAWAFGKLGWNTARTYVQAPFAALGALETTSLQDIHRLPANMMKAVGEKAVENKAVELAASSEALASRLVQQGSAFAASATSFAQPVAARMQAGAGVVNGAVSGSSFDRAVQGIAGWRVDRLTQAMEHAQRKLDVPAAEAAVGMVGRIRQFFSGDAAAKLTALTEKKNFWDAARQGGAGTFLRNVPKALGRMPVGRALLVAGVAAGSAAMLLRTKAENSHSATLLNELAADVYGVDVSKVTASMLSGPQAPILLKQASQNYGKSVRGNWMAGAAQVAGEGLWLMPNMGIAPAMLVGSSSGFISDMVKTDNPYLNAYGVLKAEAKGQEKLAPEQKAGLVTMLVGATPAVAAHGGARNKMARPIAEQMIAEGLSPQQIVREIASPAAIEKRAVKVHEAMAAKAANVNAPEASARNVAPANENTPTKLVGAVEPQGRIVQNAVAAARA